MFGIGATEIIMILGVALIVIGPKNLPTLAKAVGKGYAEFMKGFKELKQSLEDDVSNVKSTLDPLEEDVADLKKTLDPTEMFNQDESSPEGKEDAPPKPNSPPKK